MITVIQRVTRASVVVGGEVVGQIGPGLVALTAVHGTDTDDDLRKTAEKLLTLRVFPEGEKAYHLDVTQVAGGVLVVPNFTVAAETSGGRRPGLHPAAAPAVAGGKFAALLEMLRGRQVAGVPGVEAGRFGANMRVEIHNDGPLTVIYDTRGK